MNNNEKDYIKELNEVELNVLNELKKYAEHDLKLEPGKFNDLYLLRFCRARKFNKEKVFLMFKNFIDFRKKYNVDKINENKFPDFKKLQSLYTHGYINTDKQGRPIYIEKNGKLNPQDIYDLFGDDEELILKNYILSYERLIKLIFPECSRVKGKLINKTLTILDLEGITISKLMNDKFKNFLKLTIKIAQDNYPELMGNMYIINVPWNFRFVYFFAKAFIDDKTKEKIQILGSDYKKTLLKYIDEDQLPEFLGGKFKGKIVENNGPWKELFDYSLKNNIVSITREDYDKKINNVLQEKEKNKLLEKENKILLNKENNIPDIDEVF